MRVDQAAPRRSRNLSQSADAPHDNGINAMI